MIGESFLVELVLAAHPGQVRPPRPAAGVRLLVVTTPGHAELLRAVHADPAAAVPNGGGAVLAVRGDIAVAAAGWTAVEQGTSELVGVVTVAHERRRGHGGLVVAAAAAAAAQAGADLLWLRTSNASAHRLYVALGFEETPGFGPPGPQGGR